jgi:hypothetical protein
MIVYSMYKQWLIDLQYMDTYYMERAYLWFNISGGLHGARPHISGGLGHLQRIPYLIFYFKLHSANSVKQWHL